MPIEPRAILELQNSASEYLPPLIYSFFSEGVGDNQTLRENVNAFKRLRLRPRILRDVGIQNCQTNVLGRPVDFPFGIAPSSFQKLAHKDGEMAMAKAAADCGAIYILSSYSTTGLEEIAVETPASRKWLQLYVLKDRRISENLIRRAEKACFEALVVTVDRPVLGQRSYASKTAKTVVPSYVNLVNIERSTDQNIYESIPDDPDKKSVALSATADLTWKDLKWLQNLTTLPIILKGILTSQDALLAVQHNVTGIIVSNHGGRQLDGTPASIEALPEIVHSVRGRCEIYMDGGVTNGTDVFKALALGAKAVFLGRGPIWGLAHNGEEGVKHVLNLIKSQLTHTMALMGCQEIMDIQPNMIAHCSYYSKL